MKAESNVQLIFGRKGSGKSTLGENLMSVYRRVIFFDFLNEHSKSAKFKVRSARDFIAFDKKHPNTSVIFASYTFEDESEHSEEVEAILNYLYKTGENTDKNAETVLFFEEGQFYFPEKLLTFTLKKIITGGRHAQLNMIITTQRPAQISKALVSSADIVYMSFIWEKNDYEYIKRSFPQEVVSKFEFLHDGKFLKYSNKTKDIDFIEVFKSKK